MASTYYILRDGAPVAVDFITWAHWFEEATRRVAWTDVAPDVYVSTVFLGRDHGWGNGPPVLWETLVFGGVLNEEMTRYVSEAEARAGHEAMVARVRRTLPLR